LVLSASGGVSPYTWTLISGSPPPGLSFDGTGRLAGTPTTEGTYTFSVQVRDSLNGLGTAEFVITVNPQLTILTTSPLTDGTVGTLYRLQFAGKGGQTPYIWTIASGSLPQGLSLNTSGALTGTPTAGGASSFGVKLTDLQGTSVTATFSITVAAAAKLTITSQSPLPDGKVGVVYNAQLAATGGSGTLSWSIQTGSLPAGLSLSSAGLIGGTPTAEGTSSVTVVVTDSATPTPQRAQQTFSITVTPSSITITTTSLPAGTGGSPYSATLAATGGTPPYSWSLAGGSLPSGVTLNATSGAISGTPSAGGSFAVTVGVADSTGATGTKAFTLVVNVPQAPSLTISDLPTPAVPNQQPQFRLALAQAYPLDISGQLTLTFSSTVGVDDPMIRFANGTRVLGFTVPAGATAPVFGAADRPVLLTGTTAGTITLTVTTYQAGGQDVQPIPPPVTIQIPAGAPVITSVTATRNSSGFTVRVAGFTTQRQVTRARFQFNGTNLQTTEVSPPVDSAFNTWFQSTQSNQFGTQFSLTQPFNVQGDPQTVTSVTVTLSSAAGDSTPATAQLQ
jgi:hypothetical protein